MNTRKKRQRKGYKVTNTNNEGGHHYRSAHIHAKESKATSVPLHTNKLENFINWTKSEKNTTYQNLYIDTNI